VECASGEEAKPVVVVVGDPCPIRLGLLDEEASPGPVGPSCAVVGEDLGPPAGDGPVEAPDAEPVTGLGHSLEA